MRQEPKDIDTYGFPYVVGVSQRIYKSLPLPQTEQDCIQQLTKINHIIKDIKLQLQLAEIDNKASDDKWRRSAIKKQQILIQQKILLLAHKETLNNKAKKNNQSAIQELFRRIEDAAKKNNNLAQHLHQVALKSANSRSVLLALVQALENGTVDDFIKKNSETLDNLKTATLKEDWGIFKKV
jgi:hypothetical protein